MTDIKGKFTKLNLNLASDPIETLATLQGGQSGVKYTSRTSRYIQQVRNSDTFLTVQNDNKKIAALKPLQQMYHSDFNFQNQEQIEAELNKRQKIVQVQKVVTQLTEEKEMFIIDKEITERKWVQGLQAEQLFSTHYKRINKVLDQNQSTETQNSQLTNLFLAQQQAKIFPSKLGLVKKPNSPQSCPLNHFKYGDKYIDALSYGQQLMPQMQTFLLKNNRITEQSSNNLIKMLSSNLIVLDISFNTIGNIGCKNLCTYLQKPETQIEKIILKQNELTDLDIKELLPGLIQNKTVRQLNLQRNKISDDIFESLIIYIEKSAKLQELYLGWNTIGQKGGNLLFKQIETNKYLKVLDISWNNLQGDVTNIWNNTHLIHLDLSNNKFTYTESKLISEALDTNRTIYGFHFKGNYGVVDNQGFLIVDKKERNCENSSYKSINGVQYKPLKKLLNNNDNCWICDNWRQCKFEWTPKVSSDQDVNKDDVLFLHLEFENYKGLYFGDQNEKGTYCMEQMTPHYKFNYFYSINQQEEIAQDQPSLYVPKSIENIYQQLSKNIYKISGTNQMLVENFEPIFNKSYECQTTILPRTPKLIHKEDEKPIAKQIWKFKDSIFADYKRDTDEKFYRCFDFDLSFSKIVNFIKDEDDLQKTKKLLRKYYKQIRNLYRIYSCMSPIGQIWAISVGPFNQFIKDLQILGPDCKEEDITLKWTAVTTQPSINQRSPQRAIVRHQFMELLGRLVGLKFVNNKITKTYHEGFQIFFDNYFLKLCTNIDPQQFREEEFWNEQNDKIIKHYMEPIKYVFKHNSSLNVLPGQKPHMCLEELIQITKQLGLEIIDANFSEKDVYSAFCMSQNCVVDELLNNQVFEMNLQEFVEALGLIAKYIAKSAFKFNQELLSNPKYQKYHESLKLESLCQLLRIIYVSKKSIDFQYNDQSIFLKKDGSYSFGFYD